MRVSNRLHSVSEVNISCSIGSRPQLKKTKQEEGGRERGKEELPEHLNDLLCLRFIYKSQSSEVRMSLCSHSGQRAEITLLSRSHLSNWVCRVHKSTKFRPRHIWNSDFITSLAVQPSVN